MEFSSHLPCELLLPFLSLWTWEMPLVPVHSALGGKGQRVVMSCCTGHLHCKTQRGSSSILPQASCPGSLCSITRLLLGEARAGEPGHWSICHGTLLTSPRSLHSGTTTPGIFLGKDHRAEGTETEGSQAAPVSGTHSPACLLNGDGKVRCFLGGTTPWMKGSCMPVPSSSDLAGQQAACTASASAGSSQGARRKTRDKHPQARKLSLLARDHHGNQQCRASRWRAKIRQREGLFLISSSNWHQVPGPQHCVNTDVGSTSKPLPVA